MMQLSSQTSSWLRSRGRGALGVLTIAAVSGAVLTGCKKGPLFESESDRMRAVVMQAQQDHLRRIADAGIVKVSRDKSDVEAELSDERREELDQISGVAAYEADKPQYGKSLVGGEEVDVVEISLERAVELAIAGNLDLKVVRLVPAITAEQVTQADAIFDVVLFGDVSWQKLDTPQPPGPTPGLSGDTQTEDLIFTAGLRKLLDTGGTVTLQTDLTNNERTPSLFTVNDYWTSDVILGISQPLLRGFGDEVNRAQVVLTENAEQADVARLRQSMLEVVFSVEQSYWQLRFSLQRLKIQTRLLDRTIEDRDRLVKRRDFDVSPVRITEANSFVELRRADVIRARQQVRDASDALKRLVNSPEIPLAGEVLLVASDTPNESQIEFSLLDAITTALDERPELEVARLAITDAGIRQKVADNAKLPLLNLIAQTGFNGLDTDDAGDSYDALFDGDYIDYALGAEFEYPLGNRSAEALYTQRMLEARQATEAYQREAQTVVLEVKNALRSIVTSYELIGATRASRRAAADSLRAIEEQEKAGVALTPEFLLDLKLSTQERLADAETQEAEARLGYNVAIAQLYETMGTLLKTRGIDFDEASRIAEDY